MLRFNPTEELKLDEQDFIILNSTSTSPKTILEIPTTAYVDSLSENDRNRRDLLPVFNDQNNEFENTKLTNLVSSTVNRIPTLDNELSNKNYIDDELNKDTLLRFSQALKNYVKVSIGNDVYNLTKYDEIQTTDTTNIKYPNNGGYLLQRRNVKCSDKNGSGKTPNFIRSTETTGPTGNSGATNPPPSGDIFMYIETISNISASDSDKTFLVLNGLILYNLLLLHCITRNFQQ